MKKIIIFLPILLLISFSKIYGQPKPDFYRTFRSFDINFLDSIRYHCTTTVLAEIRTSCTGEITSVTIVEGDTSRFERCVLESLRKLKKTDRQLDRHILYVAFTFLNEVVICDENKQKANSKKISETITTIMKRSDCYFLDFVTINSGLEERRGY